MNIHVQFSFDHICNFWEEVIWTFSQSPMLIYVLRWQPSRISDRSSRIVNMVARANNMLWLAEISKIFFSETNELTEPKL
jgi:hypothetical protein